jgi:hypothetical protein
MRSANSKIQKLQTSKSKLSENFKLQASNQLPRCGGALYFRSTQTSLSLLRA